jgi:hypothetical protein
MTLAYAGAALPTTTSRARTSGGDAPADEDGDAR